MKTNKIIICLISIFLVLAVGCTVETKNERNRIKNEGNKIIVEKRVGEADKYEYYNEIEDNKEVQKAKDILNTISWENATVSMAYTPHYKFHFEDSNSKSSGVIYELWVSLLIVSKLGRPHKDCIFLIFSIIIGGINV